MREDFQYDNLDRLVNVHKDTTMTLDMAYDATKGGITTKRDAGTLLYNTSDKPYAVSSINPTTGLTPTAAQSITFVVNATTNELTAEYSYDAWGRMRNPSMWVNYAPGSEPELFVAGRGFTDHEHLPWFNLINMNGRVYDPLIAMFLSPDNYVQNPELTQNFNRYGYCLNNPLKYADPSGEFLTWSFHNGGFSIGFNLTPIGIPLGAGINIGWGKGFSLGGYGELGYRVGGTGFGSGATVSQSLDYNFKNNGLSTTTADGTYLMRLTTDGNVFTRKILKQ